MLNIDNAGNLKVYGRAIKDIESYIAKEADAIAGWPPASSRPTSRPAQDLPTTIVIRADRATPFKMLNRVIKACQDNGFRKFALKAVNKEA